MKLRKDVIVTRGTQLLVQCAVEDVIEVRMRLLVLLAAHTALRLIVDYRQQSQNCTQNFCSIYVRSHK